jgi:DNA-binding LacI/PurR family transcriptional regulator
LTTVGPLEHTFDETASLMLHRLTANEQMPPKKVIQKWQLIIRESTSIPSPIMRQNHEV